jgi:hypothetical protein
MPFTFSHPAAVLPLKYLPKNWYSLTGLIIGSLTPDFEYFIRMRVYSSLSHTWTGLFWFDIPLAIILAYVFHRLVKDSLIESLPHFMQTRFVAFKEFKWTAYLLKNPLVVILSCMIGIASHILWDGFTHQHGNFVQTITELQQSLFVSGYSIPVYKLLQHISSFVGGLVIIYAIWKMPIHTTGCNGMKWSYWLSVVLIAVVALTIRVSTSDNIALGNIITSAIAGVLIGLILIPVFLLLKYKSMKH